MFTKPGLLWKGRQVSILRNEQQQEQHQAGTATAIGSRKRIWQLLFTCAAVFVAASAIGYAVGLVREALSGNGYIAPDTPPVNCAQFTVAVVPLTPSAQVLAAITAEKKDRLSAADKLVDAEGLDALCTDLKEFLPFTYQVAPARELPDSLFDFERKQYSTVKMLKWLLKNRDPGNFREIGVLPVDVFAPGYNFLFGQAKARGPVCVSSCARMSQFILGARLTPQERWHSIVRHEFGHTLGLPHTDERSVMQFCNTLNELDGQAVTLSKSDWIMLKELQPQLWDSSRAGQNAAPAI